MQLVTSTNLARALGLALFCMALLTAIAACDGVGNDFEGEVTDISLGFPASTALVVGETVTVEAFVSDNFGVAAPGISVAWSVTEGTVASETSVTNAGGIATAEWTLGTIADVQGITARAEAGKNVIASLETQISIGLVSSIEAELDRDTLEVGQTTALRVTRLADAFGNEIPRDEYNRYGIDFFSLDLAVAEIVPQPTETQGEIGLIVGVRGVSPGDALIAATAAAAPPREGPFRLPDGAAADTIAVSVLALDLGGPFAAASISAGARFTCGIDTEDVAYCWGANATGQLGTGDFMPRLTPTPVVGLSGAVTSISAGGAHACALLDSGEVYCWGTALFGRLGNNVRQGLFPTPVLVQFPQGIGAITEVQTGGSATCALTADGEAYCWGYDVLGTLGDGAPPLPNEEEGSTVYESLVPVRVAAPDGTRFVALSYVSRHVCAVTDTGAGYCWGQAEFFKLGIGFTDILNSPVPARVQPTDVSFAAIATHTIATSGLGMDGQLYGWGQGADPDPSASGLSSLALSATPVPGSRSYKDLDGGEGFHACALTTSGEADCWGNNLRGYLGTGDTTASITPIPVVTDQRFESIDVSTFHSCAIVEGGGEAYCWGSNEMGEVGTGTTDLAVLTPTRVETAPEGEPRPSFETDVLAHRRAWCASLTDRLRRTSGVCGAGLR